MSILSGNIIEPPSDIIVVFAYLPFISDKKYLEEVKSFISQNNIEGDVRMLTNLNQSDLAKLYQTSYCAVLPANFETYGLFMLESMLSSLPIFATNVGVSSELLGKVDLLFLLKNNSIKTISDKLNVFFSRPTGWHVKIRKKITLNNHKFDFESPVTKLNQLFTNI